MERGADDPVRWLDGTEAAAWRGWLRAHAVLSARLNGSLQHHDLSAADYEVLVNLSEARDHELRLFELARAMAWERSRVSHQLTRMERRGLVERRECTTDRRGAFVGLTDAGFAAIQAAAPDHVADVRRWFADVLSADQLAALVDIESTLLDVADGPLVDGPVPEGRSRNS